MNRKVSVWAVGLLLGAAAALAAPCAAQYGDVDGDGHVSIVDAKAVLSYAQGKRFGDARDLRIRRYGDVAPLYSSTVFGDGTITVPDAVRILRRAAGLETDAPVPDYWPIGPTLQGSGTGATTSAASYTYLDQFGASCIAKITGTYALDGHIVTVYQRSDGTQYDLYKDSSGNVYIAAATITLGSGYSPSRITLSPAIPLVYQDRLAAGAPTSWKGQTTGTTTSYGVHPVTYTITLLRSESTPVPAAGALPFDGTRVVRFGFEFLKTASSPYETQQSWFFWLAPYVGPVQEGRASVSYAEEPDLTAKSLWQAQTATVYGKAYP